jgi:enoyl-CoA hydratase/carnithine racemase
MPIGLEIDQHIATITLGGANELNPLDYPLLYELDEKYLEVAGNPDVRVVILRGAGEKHFCAGYNLKVGIESFKADEDRLNYDSGPFYFRGPPKLTYRRLLTPVIGAARGWCLGAGMCLFGMNTDIRIVGESSKFGFVEMKRALAGATVMCRLPFQLPYAAMMWMATTGEYLDAATAYRLGYVNEVVPDDQVMIRARELAERIAAAPPLSLRAEKWSMHRGETATHRQAVDFAAMLAALNGFDLPTVEEMRSRVQQRRELP